MATYKDRVYNHSLRVLGNREDAEEAAQDVFLKAHKGLGAFRCDSDVRTWLFRITVTTCIDRLRKFSPGYVHPDEEEPDEGGCRWDEIATGDASPETILIEKDMESFTVREMEL